jgi:hypothetical protein
MPMPPPKPSTEPAPRKRQRREIEQLTRALTALGPSDRDSLAGAVGAAYWDPGRFDRALAAALDRGLVVVDTDGRYAAV